MNDILAWNIDGMTVTKKTSPSATPPTMNLTCTATAMNLITTVMFGFK